MAEVRVRLPLGASSLRAWESLGFRRFREPERQPLRGGARGSNPAALTLLRWGLCWYRQAVVNRPFAGSIPAAAAFANNGRASQLAMAPRSNRDELHGLGSSTLPPSAL